MQIICVLGGLQEQAIAVTSLGMGWTHTPIERELDMSDNGILLSFLFIVIISAIILVWWYSEFLKARMKWFAGNFNLWLTGHPVEKTPTYPMVDYWPNPTKEPVTDLPTHSRQLAAFLFGVTIFAVGLSFAWVRCFRRLEKRVNLDDNHGHY